MVKDIFEKFDADYNGVLDKDETRKFFLDQMR